MESLDDFIERVETFNTLTPADKIPYFCYYIQGIAEIKPFNPKDVTDCFSSLHLKPYSNIPAYLTSKSKGKSHILLKNNKGYMLERSQKEYIETQIGTLKKKKATNKLFPQEIFNDTRGYIKSIAEQAAICYDFGLFDGCSVLIRKLVETLIIETFERFKVESKIKNGQGNYFYLSDLVTQLINEKNTFNVGRNTIQALPQLKKLGDLSAHNRRYVAKQSDIDKIKDDLRITLEELVHIIDYQNWK